MQGATTVSSLSPLPTMQNRDKTTLEGQKWNSVSVLLKIFVSEMG